MNLSYKIRKGAIIMTFMVFIAVILVHTALYFLRNHLGIIHLLGLIIWFFMVVINNRSPRFDSDIFLVMIVPIFTGTIHGLHKLIKENLEK